MRRMFVTTLLLLVAAAGAAEPQQQTITPAGRMLHGWLEAFNSDRETFEHFVESHYDKATFGDAPDELHVKIRDEWKNETGRLELVRFTSTSELQARALGRAERTGLWYTLTVRIAGSGMDRIAGIGLNVTLPPDDLRPAPVGEDVVREQLRHLLDTLADADIFSGTVLIAKNGKVVVREARGFAHQGYLIPNRPQTRFNLGSLNKTFTAVAVGQLLEQEKLTLDDPIGMYLPDYPNEAARQTATIGHLLTHSSGISDFFGDDFFQNRQKYVQVSDYFPLFAAEPLEFEPGSKWSYSNGGFIVLGRIIEVVSGKNYFDYIQQHVLEPAGMTSTGFFEMTDSIPDVATGYSRRWRGPGSPPDHRRRSNVLVQVFKGSPAGGAFSNVDDLLKFDQALRNGTLISSGTLRLFTTPQIAVRAGRHWGYGFSTEYHGEVAGHGGDAEGIGADWKMDFRTGYTAVILTNYDGAPRRLVMAKIEELLGLGNEH